MADESNKGQEHQSSPSYVIDQWGLKDIAIVYAFSKRETIVHTIKQTYKI